VVSFTLGSILAAVAKGFALLLVGRSFQGIGGGGIMVLTEILIADLIPLRERGKWFSIRSGTWALGTVVGPLIGGGFTESSASWRWIFWINLPFCGLGLILIPIFLKLNTTQIPPLRESLKKIDFIGSFLFVASLTSFLIPITWGGTMYAWDSWHTLVPLILGVAGLIGFCMYERFIATQPLIPLVIFNNVTMSVSYAGCFLHGVILWAVVYYLPLYYEGSLGYKPVIAGIAMFPECFTVAPISVITGFICAKVGRYRWALWFGWPVTILGIGLLCLLDSETSIPKWLFINLVAGVGVGTLYPTVMLAVQAAANPEYLSISVSMTPFFRVFGQAVGVAIGGVVFQNRIIHEFGDHPSLGRSALAYAQDASSLVQYIHTLPKSSAERNLLESLYAKALVIVWAVMCGIGGLALLLSLFTKDYTLNQALSSKQGLQGRPSNDVESGGSGDSGDSRESSEKEKALE
jgi:MFS family permease